MTIDRVGGSGIWTEYENTDTGERSIKSHAVKPVKQWCAKNAHDFIIADIGKRLAVCSLCGQEVTFVVGKHTIDGNKVLLT